MLKIRIIPTLLFDRFGLVKGKNYVNDRRIGTALPAVKVYNNRDVDELVMVDIGATKAGRLVDINVVRELANNCFVPLTIGGGVKSIADFRSLLSSGADKVVVNSAIYDNPDLVNNSAKTFGAQCVVASIDIKRVGDNGSYKCFRYSGAEATEKDPVSWALEMEDRGAGEILLGNIVKDGTMTGYDIDIIQEITSRLSIPLIASGGAGEYEDFVSAVNAGASAVAAASIFHFTQQTPMGAKNYLLKQGYPMRRKFNWNS